jgi:hypothetical protein
MKIPFSKPPLCRETFTLEDFKRWGSEGGKKSRRKLTTEQARSMVKAKNAKQTQKSCNKDE